MSDSSSSTTPAVGGSSSSQTPAADDPEFDAWLEQAQSVAYGGFMPLIVLLGTVGNALNLLVFARAKFRAVSYLYLKALSTWDLVAMSFMWVWVVRLGWRVPMDWLSAATYFAHFELVVVNTFLVCSALTVLAITIDRYIAVCHPFRARYLITRTRTLVAICACFVVPLLLYLPYSFERYVVAEIDPDTNLTIYKSEIAEEMFQNDFYQKGYKWFRVTLFKILPIILVIGLNSWTCFQFQLIIKRKKALVKPLSAANNEQHLDADSSTPKSKEEKAKAREDKRLMVLLVCVAMLYVICLTPMAIVFLTYIPSLQTSYSYQVFLCIANLLEIFNSAMNFYIYCLGSKDFRRQFLIAIGFRKRQELDTSHTNAGATLAASEKPLHQQLTQDTENN